MKNWRVQLSVGWRTEWQERINEYLRGKIAEAREDIPLSQRELSKTLERSKAYISQIESGRLELSVVDLVGLAFFFDKPLKYFLPLEQKDEGELSGEEWELVRNFRKIDDERIRQAATKHIVQLAKAEKPTGKK